MLESILRSQTNPKITFHPDFNQYGGDASVFHEAGYDAYMTAVIMIRLAARLAHEGGWQYTHSQHPNQNVQLPRHIASESKDYLPMDIDAQPIAVIKDHGIGLAEPGIADQQHIAYQLTPKKAINFFSLGRKEDESFPDNVTAIPGFYDERKKFWAPYMNRLRMFQTDEGVLKLPGIMK